MPQSWICRLIIRLVVDATFVHSAFFLLLMKIDTVGVCKFIFAFPRACDHMQRSAGTYLVADGALNRAGRIAYLKVRAPTS